MKHGVKLAAFAAALLFAAVLVWSVFYDNSDTISPIGSYNDEAPDFLSGPAPAAASSTPVNWIQPTSQGGPNWIFDIFTPPVIYYDEKTGAFTVTPPFPEVEAMEETFELELLEVSRVPYRLQLVSYAGERGNYVLTLEDLDSGRDIFCAPGDVLPDPGIRVVGFEELRAIAPSVREGTTEAFDIVGEARIEELDSGKHYTLFLNTVTYLEKPVARFLNRVGENVYLTVGDTWESNHERYMLREVDLTEQTASVEKSSLDVGDKLVKFLQASHSFNSSDLSNRNTRASASSPGTF